MTKDEKYFYNEMLKWLNETTRTNEEIAEELLILVKIACKNTLYSVAAKISNMEVSDL